MYVGTQKKGKEKRGKNKKRTVKRTALSPISHF
jgi:hypothetical protein